MLRKGIIGIVGIFLILLTLAGTVSALNANESNATPEIVSILPDSTTVNNNVGEMRTFIITTNQEVNVTWFINRTQVQSNTSVNTSAYINDSAAMGSWNVTAIASNDKGTDTNEWDWIVRTQPFAGVEIKNLAFNPASIEILKGMTVIWTNNDSTTHTVTSDTNLFDSGNVNQGQTFEFTFNEIGTFNYHCSIHPEMLGEITVIPAPTPIQPLVEEIGIDLELVAENFTAPIALVSPDDGTGRRFIVDQIGVIRILTQDGQVLSEPFLNLSSKIVNLRPQYDERGLLGLAFHPNFKQNGLFYVYYSAPLRQEAPANWDATSTISEFRVLPDNPNKTNESSERILLQVDKPQSNHNAGQIAFGPDGYLYIPIGDGGNANDEGMGHPKPGNAQNISTLLGKILRVDVDNGTPYGIPPDNPFVGKDGLDEIFAYGLRNPFRIAFDAGGNNSLFVSDAGQNAWEEVNIVTNGGNYGWNIREGTHCFDPNNPNLATASCPDVSTSGQPLIDPVIEYANAGQSGGIGVVVVGGFVYRGNLLPRFNGDYLFGDFSKGFTEGNGSLFVARPPPTGQKMWSIKELKIASSASGRIGAFVHSFGQDSDNEIYVLTSDMLGPANNTGKVFKIKPVAISRIFTANLSGDEEVPPIDTPARGNATFELNDNGTMLHYRLMVENITNVTMAHIHMAPFGQNGSIVAWLYPNAPPAVLIPGRFDGLLAEGNITSANLTGPLAGKSFDILMESIMNETAYVNVHTDRYPAGEIRGQIKPAAPSVAPEITNFTPEESNVTDIEGGPTRTFTINVNQIVNVSWQINGEEVSSQTSVNTSSYSNAIAAPGIWNVTAIASNLKGSDTHMWVWTVTKQIIGNSSISGMKFNDSNGNGIKDPEESGFSNWTIVLKNSTGSIVKTMMTDVNGSYTLSNLTPGNYIVAEVLNPDWKQTLPANGTYNVTVTGGENLTGIDFGNNLPVTPPANVTKAVRVIEKKSIRPGESTNITVDITSNMSQALSLHEIIPAEWNLTRISDDADTFKSNTSEWIWFNVTPGINKTVIYRLTAPDNVSIGTFYINGTINSSSGVIAVVLSDNTITLASPPPGTGGVKVYGFPTQTLVVAPGATFTFSVNIDSGSENLQFAHVELNYDKTNLTANTITSGNLLGADALAEPGNGISPGKVKFGLARTASAAAPVNGTFITVQFKARGSASGIYVLDLANAVLMNSTTSQINNSQVIDGQVNVSGTPELNWKFISVPYMLNNASVDYVLRGLVKGTDYTELYAWDTVGKQWMSPVTNFTPLNGYLIKIDTSKTMPALEKKTGAFIPPSLGVTKGWNLIGTSGENSIAAETMLNAIDDSYYSIWNWNVEDQMYDPVVGINSNSRPAGSVGTDAFIMQPGISYWVWATKDTSLPALGP